MAITIREQQDAASNSGGISFTASTAVVGDRIILIVANDWYTTADMSTPTGTAVTTWNLRHTGDGGDFDTHSKVWEGVVTTAGGTVVTNWVVGDEERYGGIWVTPDGQFDVAATTDTDVNSTSHVAPSVTASAANGLLICLFSTGGTATDYTVPGTLTFYTERDVTPFATYRAGFENLTSAGATGTRTVTSASNTAYLATSVVLIPLPGSGPPIRHRHMGAYLSGL